MIGTTVSHYRIVETLGSGGMGVVYKAQDTQLGRLVALKFLPQALARDRDALERFRREARSASALDHPNICTVYDIAEHDGQPFIVMALLEGETLQRLVEQPVPLDRLLDLGSQVADALAATHAKGLIHRDLKPANIFVTTRGHAKVLDFGLATSSFGRASAEQSTMGALTLPGVAPGTAPYMSPEQARAETLDARTDLFSFGAVLYEMATGRRAFDGSSIPVIFNAILDKTPPSILQSNPRLPPELGRIIHKALEKNRDLRYQSAADLRTDLERLKRDLDPDRIAAPTPSSGHAASPHTRWSMAGLAIALLLILTAWIVFRGGGQLEPIDSLAVLPFADTGGDPDTEYLSDGITDSLINGLSQLRGMRIVPRSTVFRYKGKNVDPQEVGRALNVRAVLSGRLTRRGDTLVIGAELVDVARQSQLWGAQYNRKMADIMAIQTAIAREISTALRLQLSGEDERKLTRTYTENTEAYQLYLKGLYHRQKTTEEGFNESLKYFRQAVDLDPTYPLAYAGLSDTYGSLAYLNLLAPDDVWPKAKAAAMAALKLDASLAEAHAALGHVALRYDWDWERAKLELEKAIELSPNHAVAHHWYAHYWVAMGRPTLVLAESRRAVELEPLDLMLNTHLLFMLAARESPDELRGRIQQVRDIEPDFWSAHTTLGTLHLRQGLVQQGLAELEAGARLSNRLSLALMPLGAGYARVGRRADAERVIAELERKRYVPSYWVATIYRGLGDRDAAFKWLERGYQEHDGWLVDLKTWPESWQSDARFQTLVRRVGLPP